VHAVYGNVDGWELRQQVGESVELERLGHRIAVVHGHQWGSPKVKDLAEAYHDFSVVIYGHTHQPLVEMTAGPLVVNPGSAGHQSFRNPVTAAILTLERQLEPSARLIDLLP
jgi:putative phosphoesterase